MAEASARDRSRVRVTAWALSPAVRDAVALVLGLRVALGLAGWIGLVVSPASPDPRANDTDLLLHPGDAGWAWFGPWQRDDALIYQRLALHGYSHGGYDDAFYPLYPMSARALSLLLHVDALALLLLISTVALVAALVALHHLVAARFDVQVARRTVLLVALGPVAFFLLAPFTESLFLATSVAVFLFAERRQGWAAGVCAALAALCRIQGALLVVPLLAAIWRGRRGGVGWSPLLWRQGYASVALAPLALLGFYVYLAVGLGVQGGPFGAGRYFGRSTAAPWSVLADSVRTVVGGGHSEEAWNLLLLAVAVGLLPAMWRLLPRAWTVYAGLSVLVPLCEPAGYSPLMSFTRYVAVVFPMFVIVVLLTRARELRWQMVLMLSAGVMLMRFGSFTHFHFVG